METVESVYGKRFFARRHKLHWRAPIFCAAVNRVFPEVKSIYDLGCATGDLIRHWLDQGFEAFGIEGSAEAEQFLIIPPGHYLIHDLRTPLELEQHDMVLSLEVAEHIDPAFTDIYVDNLCKLAGRCIVISAAPPGQDGHGHVNCQPQSYWVRKLRERSFKFSIWYTAELREQLKPWAQKDGIRAFYNNLMVFWRVV